MSDPLAIALAGVIGYLLGSIPAGYVAGRIAGVDIRKEGSGNVGATNVVRVLGKRYGYPVFFIDLLKGVIAVVVGQSLANDATQFEQVPGIVGGIAAVIGHSFPIWLGFRGGKGVATSIGVVFGLMPAAAVIILVVWALVFQISRYVSLASIIAAIALPIVVAVTYARKGGGVILLYFALILAALVVFRHRSNIGRLLRRTEPRFKRR